MKKVLLTESEYKKVQSVLNESVDDKVYLSGLKTALERFDNNGKYAKQGHWEIGRGGYDLWWEISYDFKPVIRCIYGEVEFNNNEDFDEATQNKIKVILKKWDNSLKLPKTYNEVFEEVALKISYYCKVDINVAKSMLESFNDFENLFFNQFSNYEIFKKFIEFENKLDGRMNEVVKMLKDNHHNEKTYAEIKQMLKNKADLYQYLANKYYSVEEIVELLVNDEI